MISPHRTRLRCARPISIGRSIGFALMLGCLVNGCLWAQRTAARLSGVISDTSGAVIPGVRLKAIEISTGAVNESVTNANGYYIFNNLPPGEYRLNAEKQGFKTYVQSGIFLRVAQPSTVNLVLAVGAISQQITISGAATQVNTVTCWMDGKHQGC